MDQEKLRAVGIAAFTQGVFGRRMIEFAHKLGVEADERTPPDSILRDPTVQRFVMAGLGAIDVAIENPIIKTILPTAGEMFVTAFIDGQDEVQRALERYRSDTLKRIRVSENPEQELELLERRVAVIERVATAGLKVREAVEATEKGSGARPIMETLRERFGGDALGPDANVLDIMLGTFDRSSAKLEALDAKLQADHERRMAAIYAEQEARRRNQLHRRFFRWLFRRDKG